MMYDKHGITIFNECNLELMKRYPDGYFELAIVDPPYGLGIAANPVRQKHEKKKWDSEIPGAEYFAELKRVSKNQIIFGGNYFLDYLGNTQGFIVWDKKQPEDFSLAMCELAWSSFQSPAKMFRLSVQDEKNKIHPTQKPVKLYRWVLGRFAKPGDKILDTHLGSNSIGIACYDLGFQLTACDKDEEYLLGGIDRLENHVKRYAPATEEPVNRSGQYKLI